MEFLRAASDIARARSDALFLMIGWGEFLAEARSFVESGGLDGRVLLTGAVPYPDVPFYLSLASIGVAPFNTAAHPPLRAGFYWSPLKVHEYMAMELPTVTIDVPPLNQLVRAEQEGCFTPRATWPACAGRSTVSWTTPRSHAAWARRPAGEWLRTSPGSAMPSGWKRCSDNACLGQARVPIHCGKTSPAFSLRLLALRPTLFLAGIAAANALSTRLAPPSTLVRVLDLFRDVRRYSVRVIETYEYACPSPCR